uniref:G-protein coupled receptors family 1 profile domain-containing protein n=1 Tax=Romanomermis culicivorax TaxID=13658 RepID=A0A915IAY6_ROMCU
MTKIVDSMTILHFSLVETFLTCKLHDGIFLFAKLPVLFTLVVSGIERFYAVRHFQTYAVADEADGNRKSSIVVPAAAICSVWLLSLGLLILLTLTAAYNNEYKIAHCSVLFVYDVNVVNITSAALLFVELCSLLFYMGMWCHTIKKLTISVDDVSDNYQLNDRLARKTTLTVSRFMLYSIFVHAICWTTILVTILLIVNNDSSATEYLIIGDYLFYTLCIIHMIIHPILSVYNCEIICLEMAKIYPFLKPLSKKLLEKETRKTPMVIHFVDHDEHFGRMNAMWENKKSKLK